MFSETKLGKWALDFNVQDIRLARLCEVDVSDDSVGERKLVSMVLCDRCLTLMPNPFRVVCEIDV